MLVLVESLNEFLLDRPNLGIAMLVASCRARGIATSLVRGQTRVLNDFFINDSKELWHLLCDLGPEDLKKSGMLNYKKLIHEKGVRQFCAELGKEYDEIIINKSLRHYLNAPLLLRFENHYSAFLKIYRYHLRALRCHALKIIDRYIAEIKNNHPRYVGFSFGRYPEPVFSHIIKRIKEELGVPIIVGGSFTRFISSGEIKKIFLENHFDYLVTGPAEHALPRLIEALDGGKEPGAIPNVYYRKNGEVLNSTSKEIDDLDALPYPDFSVFDLDRYLAPKRILPLQTARGCFWGRCAFCNSHVEPYKAFGIGRVIECIKYLRNTYDCQHIMFHDEALSAKRAALISKAMIKNQMRELFFYAYARFEKGFASSKTLSLMRKAGFVFMFWGLESGCQRVLNLMNKGIGISYVPKILKQTSRHSIANLCMEFFGFPGERKEEAAETVEFLRKNKKHIDLIELRPFVVLPFSIIARNPHKWGLKINSDGAYSVQNGMDFQETRSFLNALTTRVDASILKLTSDKLRFISDSGLGYYCYVLIALSRRLGPMTRQTTLRLIKKNKARHAYPVIPGTIENQNGKIIFSPIRTNEDVFINTRYPCKKIFLTSFEKAIIGFSDGTLSLEAIMSKIHEMFGGGNKKVDTYKKCGIFFHEIFSKGMGIAFRGQY